MKERELSLITGALLHDVGKVIYRTGERTRHSKLGYDFLKNQAGISNPDVLNCVRYHHGKELASATVEADALAYIVYIADNIAAATDRRENASEEKGFDLTVPLESIYNILNGNNGNKHHFPKVLEDNGEINMPTDQPLVFDKYLYERIEKELLDALKGVVQNSYEYIHSLLAVMEAHLTYVPSSTAIHELTDISLYDHLKMTAAYSSCIYQYLQEKNITDYKRMLFDNTSEFYKEKVFYLCSMDISGIQDYIYTIHSSGALKTLRSKSFYLEILMEHMIDEVLEECGLSRANLIYSGGGHAYLLLSNTVDNRKKIKELKEAFNEFFLKNYDIALYVAMDGIACSSMELKNEPEGSYSDLFINLGSKLSQQKSQRYSPEQLIRLNSRRFANYGRECKVCRNTTTVDDNGMCDICRNIESFSKEILHRDFYTVTREKFEKSLPLPRDKFLVAQREDDLRECMKSDDYVRTYGKNRFYTGKYMSTKLWIGDYTQKGMSTDDYAKESEGIERIAVLRADVDNLGKAFVEGFPKEYTTFSRTATFSRSLSLFFKSYINSVLKNGRFSLKGDDKGKERNITIVYSGGDDLFLVGSWNDVLEAAVDIQQQFREYTSGMLSLSAGIGLYDQHFPLSVSALEVGQLEEAAKSRPGKDSVAIFDIEYVFSWTDLMNRVIREKLSEIGRYLGDFNERGNAFLYRMLELIKGANERINLARFAYVLTRIEPDDSEKDRKESYTEFSRKMYKWVQNEKDRKELEVAIYLYVYLNRKKEEKL
ncbi:MAG: type III-A CRISPR-associated protein Cas10/Csm1 [Lachnospiraceae bacterium]|nr:type III-A CRISPR-associated protein Cas10/Csm1 [Lachnospiraceae bacterium]